MLRRGQSNRYTIVRRIARGGMGEVVLGVANTASGSHKLVIIKRVLESLSDDDQFSAMFTNEARLAAALDHPSIVRVYDVCEIEGRSSIVMEYVHGVGVGRLMQLAVEKKRKIPLQCALQIADEVASALEHAHAARGIDGEELNVIHRDVSPNNVMVGYNGEVKLIDFGIARAMTATRVTQGDAIKGKVAYMSPEQCVGEKVDHRADLFALGVVLYEMTMLRRAFRADNDFATMNRILGGDYEAPESVEPGYPPALADLIQRCLSVDPDRRPPDARSFRAQLAEVVRGMPSSAGRIELGELVESLAGFEPIPTVNRRALAALQRRRRFKGMAPAAAFAAGVALTVSGTWLWAGDPPQIPATSPPAPKTTVTVDPLKARGLVVKPQGPTPAASAQGQAAQAVPSSTTAEDRSGPSSKAPAPSPPQSPRPKRAAKRPTRDEARKVEKKRPQPKASADQQTPGPLKIPRGVDGVLPTR